MRSSQYSHSSQQIVSQSMGFLSGKNRPESCCHDLINSSCGFSTITSEVTQ